MPAARADDPGRKPRGNCHHTKRRTPSRVNPARAGMIPPHPPRTRCECGKPRASGDDPPLCRRVLARTAVNPARAGMIHNIKTAFDNMKT